MPTMATTPKGTGRYNVPLILDDMARLGWQLSDLAQHAVAIGTGKREQLSKMTVSRFLRGRPQTARAAKAIADALGQDVSRYYIPIAQPEAKAS